MSEADLEALVMFAISAIIMAICALYAARLARQKNRGVGEAVALGALLGLIGVIIVALLPARPATKRQPPPPTG